MKVRSLSSIVLLTAVVAGLAVPTAANAAESNGKVTVEAGSTSKDDPIIDPEIPGGEDIDPNTPGVHPGGDGDLGALAITNTTDLNFGKIKTANKVVEANAAALALVDDTPEQKPTGKTRGALVAWSDVRGTNAGYTITAAMTKQFALADDSKKLGGATISYTNAMLETKEINKEIAPALTASAFTLGEGKEGAAGEAVTVVNAATGKGAGTYILEFGQSADYDASNAVIGTSVTPKGEDTTASSVKLTVPQATAASMTLGDYTSTVTWSIVAAPTE